MTEEIVYDWVYQGRPCHLIWKQRAYGTALVEFRDRTVMTVPWNDLEVNPNINNK